MRIYYYTIINLVCEDSGSFMSVPSITSLEIRGVAVLAGILALRMLGLFMILPVFSEYAIQLNYSTPTLIGMAAGVYGLTQALLQIPFGFASDHWGRKSMIGLGLTLFTLGSIIAACSDTIYGVIVGRALQGGSAIGCVIMALVADLIRPEIRIKAMGIIGITIALSFALAMLIGPWLNTIIGGRGIFWVTALLSLSAILLLVTLVPAPSSLVGDNESNLKLSLFSLVWKQPQLKALNVGGLMLHASLMSLFLKLSEIVEAAGFSTKEIWQFYVPVFLGSLLAAMLYFFLMERKITRKAGLTTLLITLAISEVGILVCLQKQIGLIVSLWMFFTVFNVLEATLPALVAKYAPKESKGTALGIYSTGQFLGLFLGGVIGGWLDANYGIVAILVGCATLAVIWLIVDYLVNFERGLPWQEG